MADHHNEGIINRGNINAGSLAVGRGAKAYQTTHGDEKHAGLQKIEDELQQLIDLLVREGNELSNPEEVVRSAEKIREELAQEKPSKLTIKSLLDGIAETVGSVGTIATAVAGLRTAIGAFF